MPTDASLSDALTDQRFHRVPPKTGTLGMVLFLASLTMLFAAGMLAYLIIRLTGTNRPELGTVHVPLILLLSTTIIVASSWTMHAAVRAVQRERQTRLRQMLVATLLLSLAFVVVQAPGLWSLYQSYEPKAETFRETMAQVEQTRTTDRGLMDNAATGAQYPQEMHVLALIVIHALHVLGGLVPLFVVTLAAHQHRYDHEHYAPVKYTAWYWHFLDVVWIIMFGLIWLTA